MGLCPRHPAGASPRVFSGMTRAGEKVGNRPCAAGRPLPLVAHGQPRSGPPREAGPRWRCSITVAPASLAGCSPAEPVSVSKGPYSLADRATPQRSGDAPPAASDGRCSAHPGRDADLGATPARRVARQLEELPLARQRRPCGMKVLVVVRDSFDCRQTLGSVPEDAECRGGGSGWLRSLRVDAVRYRLPAPLHAHFCIGKALVQPRSPALRRVPGPRGATGPGSDLRGASRSAAASLQVPQFGSKRPFWSDAMIPARGAPSCNVKTP